MNASENQIVVYQPNETVRLDVRLENETVWLNQARIGELFGVDRTVVNRHIHNIYKTGELDEPSTCAKIAQVQKEASLKDLGWKCCAFTELDSSEIPNLRARI